MINDTHSLPQQQNPNPDVSELSSATRSEHSHKLASTEDGSESILQSSDVLQDHKQAQAQLRQKPEASNTFSSRDTEPDEIGQEDVLSGLDTPPEKENKTLDIGNSLTFGHSC